MVSKKQKFHIAGATPEGLTIKSVSLSDYEAWKDIFGPDEGAARAPLSIKSAFATESWFRRSVKIRAGAVSAIPWSIVRGDQIVVSSSEHEMPEGLEYLDIHDMLYRSAAALALHGRAVWLKNMQGKRIIGLVYANPATTAPCFDKGEFGPDKIGEFQYYKRTVGARSFFVPRELAVGIFEHDPYGTDGASSSDGQATAKNAQVLWDMTDFTSGQLRSGLPKKSVFFQDKDMGKPEPDTASKLKRAIRKFLLGTTPTLDYILQGFDVKQIGSDLSDLQSKEITDTHREAVASGLGVPHSLVMSNAANFATSQQDLINLYETTAIPDGLTIQNAVNSQLLTALGFRLVLEPHKIEAFQQREMQKATSIAISTGGPILTQNEGRELMGYEPTSGGDESLAEGRATDIRQWKTVVSSRGRTKALGFEPNHLTDHEASVIRERMAQKDIPIEEVFRPPFVGF